MKKAIKTLEARIRILNEEKINVQKSIDEPEMISEMEFALCDMANIESEITEHQKAIEHINKLIK